MSLINWRRIKTTPSEVAENDRLKWVPAPNWTPEDAKALKAFLDESETGRKFKDFVATSYFDACATAAENPSEHRLGQAHGRKVFWQVLNALSELGDQGAPETPGLNHD